MTKTKKKPNERLTGYAFGPAVFAGNSNFNLDITAKFSDPMMIELIKSGMRSLSPAMKMSKFECSVCKQDYELCEHEEGIHYNGIECHATALDLEPLEVSIVNRPADSRAGITDLLVVENDGKGQTYTWYGFKVDRDNRRFKHIQEAWNNEWMPEAAALHFSNYFMNASEGTIKHP